MAESTTTLTLAFAWEVLNTVLDPEVPVLSICDLGMVRDVQMQGERGLDVVLTPTYSGCPATEMIASQATNALCYSWIYPNQFNNQPCPRLEQRLDQR